MITSVLHVSLLVAQLMLIKLRVTVYIYFLHTKRCNVNQLVQYVEGAVGTIM